MEFSEAKVGCQSIKRQPNSRDSMSDGLWCGDVSEAYWMGWGIVHTILYRDLLRPVRNYLRGGGKIDGGSDVSS